MATDRYASHAATLTGPADDAVPITPSDSADLTEAVRAIRLSMSGTAGTVRVTTRAGNVRDLPIVPGEQWTVR
ncbi:spike base protein, RCAP_Rcc01079 family, partial [Segnochrobactraceae bacterium EtOH-i3]